MTFKLYAIVAGIIGLIALSAYGARVYKKAQQYETAKAALADEVKRHRADLLQVEKALAISLEDRKKLQQGLTDIRARFNEPLPPPKTLVKYVQVPGESCPRASVSDAYVLRYNAASGS